MYNPNESENYNVFPTTDEYENTASSNTANNLNEAADIFSSDASQPFTENISSWTAPDNIINPPESDTSSDTAPALDSNEVFSTRFNSESAQQYDEKPTVSIDTAAYQPATVQTPPTEKPVYRAPQPQQENSAYRADSRPYSNPAYNGGAAYYNNGYTAPKPAQSYKAPAPDPTNSYPTRTQAAPQQTAVNGYNQYGSQPYCKYPVERQTSTSTAPARVKKEKKEKRKYSLGAVIAIALCSAIICSALSSGIGYAALNKSMDKKLAAIDNNSSSIVSDTTDNNSPTQSINITGDTESLIPAVAEKASPSVVGIRVTTTSNYGFFGMDDSSASEGSGVIYTKDGYIITNYHVISTAVEGTSNYNYGYGFGFGNMGGGGSSTSTVAVFLPSDPETDIDAEIIGYDVSADIALLKINRTGLPAIEIADSDAVSVGDTTVAIGNPGGLEFMGSVSTGIVSGLNRSLYTENGLEMNLIQTDAAINPGNSGGALVNSKGQLIGINNSKIAGDGFEGMGFAIPSNTVVEITERLLKQGDTPTAYLGITIDTNYTSESLQMMGYPAGVVVFSVAEGSPAYYAGIEQYDIITAINGTEIKTFAQLNSEKNKYAPGDTIKITIFRGGQTADVNATLTSQGSAQPNAE